ncbi:unnamed protein product [Ixodes pacificus]
MADDSGGSVAVCSSDVSGLVHAKMPAHANEKSTWSLAPNTENNRATTQEKRKRCRAAGKRSGSIDIAKMCRRRRIRRSRCRQPQSLHIFFLLNFSPRSAVIGHN